MSASRREFRFSLNLDTFDDDLDISDEAHAELNSYLARSAAAGLQFLSPVVRDFLAWQKVKEVFGEAKDSAAAGLPDPANPASEVQVSGEGRVAIT